MSDFTKAIATLEYNKILEIIANNMGILLYGMFIAIFVPPLKKYSAVAVVVAAVPVCLPIGAEASFRGYLDVVGKKAYIEGNPVNTVNDRV